jgi:hypothetical protein
MYKGIFNLYCTYGTNRAKKIYFFLLPIWHPDGIGWMVIKIIIPLKKLKYPREIANR